MSAPTDKETARAFVAQDGWRWTSGMRWVAEHAWPSGEGGDGWPRFGVILAGEFFELEDCNPVSTREIGEPLPDTSHGPTIAIIAHVLLRAAWPGHSVQVESFPDGTARIRVFAPSKDRLGGDSTVFGISHEPVAVALLRAFEASS